MQQTPEQLRARSAEIRQRAQHSDDASAYHREMEEARSLEAQADKLEGKHDRPAPAAQAAKSPEDQRMDQRARVERAMGQMERMLGIKK